jgi:hypothetical protein
MKRRLAELEEFESRLGSDYRTCSSRSNGIGLRQGLGETMKV